MTKQKTYYSKFMNNKNILFKSFFIFMLSILFYTYSIIYFYNNNINTTQTESFYKPLGFSILSFIAFNIIMSSNSNFKKKKKAEKWNLLNKNKTKINQRKVYILCQLILIGILVFIWMLPLLGAFANA